MDPSVVLLELTFAVTLMRGLLVSAKLLPPCCGNCGRPYERRKLGEAVCRCSAG